MEYVQLSHTDMKISKIGIGCWAFGGGDYWGNHSDDKVSLKTIDRALDAGINFFDTAESYNDGQADILLGKGMQGRRSQFIVSSKAYLDKLRAKDLVRVVEESLVRLGTDYIDIFSPHYASKEIPFEETFGALEKLQTQGKVLHIGLCNFGTISIARMAELGLMKKIVLHQIPYSLLWRAVEYGIQPATTAQGVGLLCYSPLAQGLLSGIYDNVNDVPDNFKVLRLFDYKHVDAAHKEPGCESEMFEAIHELKALCNDAGVNLAAASISWLFRQSGVQGVLTGARSPKELNENLTSLDLDLPASFFNQMTAITDKVKERQDGNPDMWLSGMDSRIF
ncbi:MAG: aldo/keto reductase [Christensenellaceae bacterium]|jgi:myo-inositol catabolism protein IolS